MILIAAASSALCTSATYAATPAVTSAPAIPQANPETPTSARAADDRGGTSIVLEFRTRGGKVVNPYQVGMVVGNGQPGVVQREVETTFVSGICRKDATAVTYVGSDSCSQDGPRHGILTTSLFITATPTAQPDGTVFVKLRISKTHLDALVDAKSPLGTVQLPVVTESILTTETMVRPGEPTPIGALEPSGEHWEVTASVSPEVHAGASEQ